MFFLWFVLVYLMADVVPLGHSGGGAGDPPFPDPFRRGTHETDAVPARRVRGKAKNEKLRNRVKAGGAISIQFDREATYTPVGEENDLFKREADMHMWRTIPFKKMGWRNIRQSHRDAIINHLKVNKLKYIFYKVNSCKRIRLTAANGP
ncbi:hypothetical protein HanRHA438_Chr04g0200521 [Helianthus annuus]|uniref:Uncharacterized protein n=1 Tax=Helianthus annuus TaxID=4232 RepID=A0A9K3JDA0_HELAN|nr:hypothetical protein HanXRQr2_Chr04g0190731 [Helianthus annuus]KAJ0591196.1 hypothetical protein HanIR_Chr04g0205661 [Helianthus annuus]KAJ0598828.1 hypothetical protein HanHA89_Chr04g0169981 [Helianthus annuus]KAJ0763072.1 hypothetical protein HanOQP8_Chr04g0168171 [Helianthus annuus]KAJ0929038.1 hypothetical protein HanRHA438_Chr04g0200521 [Helianthus annuus]